MHKHARKHTHTVTQHTSHALQRKGLSFPWSEGHTSLPHFISDWQIPWAEMVCSRVHLFLACAGQVYSSENNMQCLHCSLDTARTLVIPPARPITNAVQNLHCPTALEWNARCRVITLPLQCSRQNSEREALRASKEGKRQTTGELQAPVWAWMSQWFLHNHAPRQFRTSISELICKHLSLARGSRGWALHISVFSERK